MIYRNYRYFLTFNGGQDLVLVNSTADKAKLLVIIVKAEDEQFQFNTKSKKTRGLFSVSQYKKLMEDLHDLVIVAERRDEQLISLDEMKQRLSSLGIL